MIDKFKTAILNGYTKGQARALERWSNDDFLVFMGEVIRVDGKHVQLMHENGRVQPYTPKDKDVWIKSKFKELEWWCRSEDNPNLASDLAKNGGKAVMGNYQCILKGDIIVRRVCTV